MGRNAMWLYHPIDLRPVKFVGYSRISHVKQLTPKEEPYSK